MNTQNLIQIAYNSIWKKLYYADMLSLTHSLGNNSFLECNSMLISLFDHMNKKQYILCKFWWIIMWITENSEVYKYLLSDKNNTGKFRSFEY